ncbi:MAG: hypothetical protein JZD41_09240 [Thermoproteus sp.]|nr:hypothetical protein [Thermoproteus sp.]
MRVPGNVTIHIPNSINTTARYADLVTIQILNDTTLRIPTTVGLRIPLSNYLPNWQLYLLGLPVGVYDPSTVWPLTTSGKVPGRYAVWGMSGWPGLYYPLVVNDSISWVYDSFIRWWYVWVTSYPIFGAPQRLSKPATYIALTNPPVNFTAPQWSIYGVTPTRPPFYCNFTLYTGTGRTKLNISDIKVWWTAYANCSYITGLNLVPVGYWSYCWATIARLLIDIDIKPYNATHLIATATLWGTLMGGYNPVDGGCDALGPDYYELWVLDPHHIDYLPWYNYNAYYYPPLLLVYQVEYLPWPKLYHYTITTHKSYIVDTRDNRGTLWKCISC